MTKMMMLLAGGLVLSALTSCGACNCNSYDRDLLYETPSSSRSFE